MVEQTESTKAIWQNRTEGTLNRCQQFGIIGVTALAEFRTAGDSDVCVLCRGLGKRDNGYGEGVYTLDQARGLIPVHPRCRCAWLPVPISIRPQVNVLVTAPKGRFIDVRDPRTGKLLFRYDPGREVVEVKERKKEVVLVDLSGTGE